ncbi:MAG: type IX secretion system membrane protein PorP/SprF [Bacteroidales bacterium]
MARVGIIAFLFLLTLNSEAQQMPMYSQYMMNRFLLNPAVAGYDGLTTLNFTAREQWLGLPYSPRTVALSADARMIKAPPARPGLPDKRSIMNLFRSGNVGLGAYIYNDRSGLIDRTGLQVSYAYHIWMQEHQLSFGVSLTGFQMKLDQRRIELEEDYDPLMGLYSKALYVPDVNSGIHLWGPSYYVGISSTQMLQSVLKFGHDGLQDFRMERVFYLMGGYSFELENGVTVEPVMLAQTSLGSSFRFDIGSKFYYGDQYWGGLSYRSVGAVVFMLGFRFERFHFGYAYDYSLNSMSHQNFGSHELMINLRFGDTQRRYRWLERY